ncbi:MAG: hypothetical protein ACFCVB_11455 [Nodosilinea sp.]
MPCSRPAPAAGDRSLAGLLSAMAKPLIPLLPMPYERVRGWKWCQIRQHSFGD